MKTPEPLIIAGPCSAESREQVLDAAVALSALGVKVFRAGIWKPRTKPGGFEGIGAEGLPWLAEVKRVTGMDTITEVATRRHVELALESGIDRLWIGARTSANPFAVQEIADTLAVLGATSVPVMVKNPVNPDLELWVGAIERLRGAGVTNLSAIHRGFSSYGRHEFRNPPQWHIPIELHRRMPELPLVCDPSHISGRRELVALVSQQAMDMGFDGLMVESHCHPECALSDAAQQLTPRALGDMLAALQTRGHADGSDELNRLRHEIDLIDAELLEVLGRRMEVSRRLGVLKREQGMQVLQMARHDEILRTRAESAAALGLDADFIRDLLRAIHAESVKQQINVSLD